ncbi:MAG: DNA-binding protein WhiA [Lachnospiraceae bacterium]|nr:DNA-binding protein WhiA [Lachnospiraceae bacterium]
MSFSSEIREELETHIGSARHCRLAEMQAIFLMQAGVCAEGAIRLKRTPEPAGRKFFTILRKAFKIDADYAGGVITGEQEELTEICQAIREPCGGRSCCRRAFLRGAFLCAGTVNDPAKSYHLEIVCRDRELADTVASMMHREGLKAGQTVRNGRSVIYLKDGEEIVELLGFMEAQRGLLKMENARVVRDVRGNVNRRVNLETANIEKAVGAAAKQIHAIEWLFANAGEEELPHSLREIAAVRRSHPEATLEELGAMLHPPVGKSGVNHRLRRLLELSRSRGYREEEDYDHKVN